MTAPEKGEKVQCPECEGTKTVFVFAYGHELEADCPYCGGGGVVFARRAAQDYP